VKMTELITKKTVVGTITENRKNIKKLAGFKDFLDYDLLYS